jgi:hypothetical protein
VKPGDRVSTPLGPARIVLFRREPDWSGHGPHLRGNAYAVVELGNGARRVYKTRELTRDVADGDAA